MCSIRHLSYPVCWNAKLLHQVNCKVGFIGLQVYCFCILVYSQVPRIKRIYNGGGLCLTCDDKATNTHGLIFFYCRSNRSFVMTFCHAAIKSVINISSASAEAYTSLMARSSVLEPKMRSTGVPVHFSLPVFLSYPS